MALLVVSYPLCFSARDEEVNPLANPLIVLLYCLPTFLVGVPQRASQPTASIQRLSSSSIPKSSLNHTLGFATLFSLVPFPHSFLLAEDLKAMPSSCLHPPSNSFPETYYFLHWW